MLKKHAIIVLLPLLGLALVTGGSALAEGDAAAGAKVFNKCKTCHITSGEAKRMGPSLECVFGRTAGSVEGYRYSKAMASSGVVWSHDTMAEYLKNPRQYLKGTKMAFAGLKNDQQIEDLLAFLEGATVGAACPK
ncbi:MAG: cytochrome c family protein [Proteobacteria bacterium]|nr:cytochrome c family protein [Pseudomonadota bacterium]